MHEDHQFFGTHRREQESMQSRLYSDEGVLKSKQDIPSAGSDHRVYFAIAINSYLYCGFTTRIEGRLTRGICKIDSSNNIVWTKLYEDDTDFYSI